MARLELIVDPSRARQGFRSAEDASNRYRRSARQATEATGRVRGSFAALANTSISLNKTFGGLAGALGATAGVAGVVYGFSRVVRATSQFERQLVEVNKTTDISGENLRNLGLNIQDIGQEIPVATDRLLSFATAAGQLGVRGTQNIESFVQTLGRLELATDIAGEQGARSLARILNITGEATSNVDRLGSSLVGLGNNFAATESEIVQTSSFLAASTTQFDLTTQEVLGLSAGLKALGQRAETSGSSVGAALGEINKAIQNGGKNLETLVELTGKSAEELERQFGDNATRVLLDFTEALQGVSDARFPEILDEFGLAGRETQRVINALVSGNDELRRALQTANVEWDKNTAAQREADKAADSLSGDLTRLSNTFDELLTQEDGLPAFRSAVQDLNETLQDPQVQAGFDGFASWLATVANVGANAVGSVADAAENIGDLAGVITQGSFGAGRVLEDMEQLNTQIDLLTNRAFSLRNQIDALEEKDSLGEREQSRLENLRQQYKANRDAISDLRDRQAELNTESETFIPTIEVTADAMTDLQKAFGGSAESARALDDAATKSLRSIGDEADETAKKVSDAIVFPSLRRGSTAHRTGSNFEALIEIGNQETGIGDDQTDAMRDASRMMDRIDRQMESMNQTGKDLGMTFSSAFEDAVIEGENFRNVLDGIVEDIARIVLRKNVTEPASEAIAGFDWSSLFSSTGTTSSMGAGTGSSPAAASYAGGGYTGDGARSGGIDGRGGFMAMMHPRETVIDHTKGGGNRPVVNVINESGSDAQVSERQDGSGRSIVDVLIPAVSSGIQQGKLDKAMTSRFQGLQPRTAGRG